MAFMRSFASFGRVQQILRDPYWNLGRSVPSISTLSNRCSAGRYTVRCGSLSVACSPATFTSNFSTMPSLKTNDSGSVGGGRQYDPEITDMASYVHNYKVDSDLAVCLQLKDGVSQH